MARRVWILLIPILCAAAASCVQLAPKTIPEIPDAVLDRFVLCADVIRTADWADLVLTGDVFDKGRDDSVCSVIVFKPLFGIHRLTWKWYDPSGRLARTSDPVTVGEEGSAFDRYIAWDRLPVFADTPAGRWTVASFVDERLIGSKEFEVKEKSRIDFLSS